MRIEYSHKSYIPPINIPGSKSITNRLYILKHLYLPNLVIGNESRSTDSVALLQLLEGLSKGSTTFHVEDGGTTLRFLLSVLCLQPHSTTVTVGPALFNRPHDGLLAALTTIGFQARKTANGFSIDPTSTHTIANNWSVDISKSSQFASALLLIAPAIGKPITIELEGKPVSLGYLEITIQLMRDLGFGISYEPGRRITIQPFTNNPSHMVLTVQSDWSGISYFVALSRLTNQQLVINNVEAQSYQPDKATLKFGNLLGVQHSFENNQLILKPIKMEELPKHIERDYTNCPDLAPTEMVACFALNIQLIVSGNTHLQYKESNREVVINHELQAFSNDLPHFNTHSDHRIAMSLAGLATIKPIVLDDIDVVSKSFPDFWQEVSKLGIQLKRHHG